MADVMVGKIRWYQSKTVWSDIVTAIVGIYAVIQPILTAQGVKLPPLDGPILGAVLSFLAGIGIYSRKVATSVIGK